MCPSIVEIVKFEKRFHLDCRYIPVYADDECNLLTSIDITNFQVVLNFFFFSNNVILFPLLFISRKNNFTLRSE